MEDHTEMEGKGYIILMSYLDMTPALPITSLLHHHSTGAGRVHLVSTGYSVGLMSYPLEQEGDAVGGREGLGSTGNGAPLGRHGNEIENTTTGRDQVISTGRGTSTTSVGSLTRQ